VFVVEGLENMVHEPLEGGGAVRGSKGHDTGGVEALGGFECEDVLGGFIDCDSIVPFSQVEFAEKNGTYGVFEDHADAGQGVHIFDGYCVYFSVVKEGSEATILLFVIEDWGTVRGGGFTDETAGFVFFDVLVLEFLFRS
jgi:hypothetical protein